MHISNSFLTLTYNNEHLPSNFSISKRELQLFIKRLRIEIERNYNGRRVRYFACGEYGEKSHRPHYHMILFGFDFPDRVLHAMSHGNTPLFRSPFLESVWTSGFSLIGDVTFESCAYVARYICKKQKGKDAPDFYSVVDKDTGELYEQEKEFCLMSRRPGLGSTWLAKYKSDTDKDFVTLRGVKFGLPKFYDSILERLDPESFEQRKLLRKESVNKEDNTMFRLRTKEVVKKSQLNFLKRNLE